MRRFAVILSLSLLALLSMVAPARAAIREGGPAPDFALKTDSGKWMRLSEFRGKPVVLNFYASWCRPCREELPALIKLKKVAKDGLVVLGVATAEPSLKASAGYMHSRGVNWPLLHDVSGEVAVKYAVCALPTTFFITSDGKIAKAIQGTLDEARLSRAVRAAFKTAS